MRFAVSQVQSAFATWPRWSQPVGLGAKRVLGLEGLKVSKVSGLWGCFRD